MFCDTHVILLFSVNKYHVLFGLQIVVFSSSVLYLQYQVVLHILNGKFESRIGNKSFR